MIRLKPADSITPQDLALQANNPAIARNLRDIFPTPTPLKTPGIFSVWPDKNW
ncbi:MAG TPA: hypothetical protein VK541_22970 [Pedobacter sp.]|uniref:hypothetical protein n=1 Tax=Pedobacter sp. TaxID=1411316 RepID=UPI002B6745FF|nr:hypothetical protein [Pedobacter sp.]HMI05370.1 hypothetical protein [Pedobacter sp.]